MPRAVVKWMRRDVESGPCRTTMVGGGRLLDKREYCVPELVEISGRGKFVVCGPPPLRQTQRRI